MFRLDDILERWATAYQPLSHSNDENAKHRTYFRISMIDAKSYFVRNFNTLPSPSMAYATHIDAELAAQNPKAISYRHVIYFLVKQPAATLSKTAITDEQGATEARFQTDQMVQDLLAYLFMLKSLAGGKTPDADQQEAFLRAWNGDDQSDTLATLTARLKTDTELREGLRGLQIDQARWGTLPTMFNGWQICGLTLEQTVPRRLCLLPSMYARE